MTGINNGMTHPHWRRVNNGDGYVYECSECEVMWEFDGGTPQENEMYYCPKCGARMSDFVEDTGKELLVS